MSKEQNKAASKAATAKVPAAPVQKEQTIGEALAEMDRNELEALAVDFINQNNKLQAELQKANSAILRMAKG